MQLPPNESLHRLVTAYAAVLVQFQDDFGERPLVLPSSEFFPDVFSHDAEGAQRLVRRMQAHAGMLDVPITTRVTSGVEGAEGGSCSSGACAPAKQTALDQRLVDLGDAWALQLSADELSHPVALTTCVARALSVVFMEETRREDTRLPVSVASGSVAPVSAEVATDLVGVGLGFGALLMEGAYVYSKSCGGPQVARLTALGVADLAVLVALFASRAPRSLRAARRQLGTTQSAALADAMDWLNGNRQLASQLHAAPELLAGGLFEILPAKTGWFGWLQPRSVGRDAEPEFPLLSSQEPTLLKALAPHRSPDRSAHPGHARDDGLSALVAEALASPHEG